MLIQVNKNVNSTGNMDNIVFMKTGTHNTISNDKREEGKEKGR